MSHFNDFMQMVADQTALENANQIFDDLASFVKAHESEIVQTPVDPMVEMAFEGAGYGGPNKYPVFIILTKGHTILSKLIFMATKDEHSHASIAFNIGLKTMYSFGTKTLDTKGNREMGFVQTSHDSDVWGDIPTEYDLYVTFVSQEARHKMYQTLQYFISNADKLKYHFAGLVRIFFHLKTTHQQKWICSRFVAAILGSGVKLDKDPSLYRPDHLSGVQNVEFVINGPDIKKYSVSKAREALEKVKES